MLKSLKTYTIPIISLVLGNRDSHFGESIIWNEPIFL